jgi:hypothetical protein
MAGNLSSLFGNVAFNPETVVPMEGGFNPIPKGTYQVLITESEIAPNKKGTGTNLTLKVVIQDGKYINRIVFDNLCVQHQNAVAQGIAQTKLAQICKALAIAELTDTSQLHDYLMSANVEVDFDEYGTNKQNNGEKVYRNSIKSYQAISGAVPGKVSPAPVANDFEYSNDVPF